MKQGINKSNVIGLNISQHRKSNNLTQEQLTSKIQIEGIDISRGTLAKIEAGIRHILVIEIEAIKKILGMKYDSQ